MAGSLKTSLTAPEQAGEAAKHKRTFILMAACFSANHGTVTALIPLASSEFGPEIGALTLGVLYFVYTFSAMLAVRCPPLARRPPPPSARRGC